MSYDTGTKQFVGAVPAVEHTCWCGVRYAVPEAVSAEYKRQNERRRGSYAIYCPLGHAGYPKGKSESDRLREELEQANSRAAQAWSRVTLRDRQLAASKGQITKLKKRVAAGVCPCCTRTFTNLARHMKGQHPDYAGDDA